MKVGNKEIEQVVFEAAKQALIEKGVRGWNMDDIAHRCEMSKRTLYKIISSKEDLLHRIFQDSIIGSATRLERFLGSDKPFEWIYARLSRQYIDGFDDYVLGNQRVLNIEYPQIHELNKKYIKRKHDITLKFFKVGIDEGYIDNSVRAQTIVKMIDAIIEHNLNSSSGGTEFRKNTKELLDGLFTAITKK